MFVTAPWSPTAIELALTSRQYWWQLDADTEDRPARWTARADLDTMVLCPDEVRHVASIDLVVADLTHPPGLLNEHDTGRWVVEFLNDVVTDTTAGTLAAELERLLTPGPPRMVVVRRVRLNDPWRGCGLAAPLLAAALHRLAPLARLAACRVRPADIHECIPGLTDVEADRAARDARRLLTRAGFQLWHGVHVAGLQDPVHRAHRRHLAQRICGTELETVLDDWLAGQPADDDTDDNPA